MHPVDFPSVRKKVLLLAALISGQNDKALVKLATAVADVELKAPTL
jgi:hypothetical protein